MLTSQADLAFDNRTLRLHPLISVLSSEVGSTLLFANFAMVPRDDNVRQQTEIDLSLAYSCPLNLFVLSVEISSYCIKRTKGDE